MIRGIVVCSSAQVVRMLRGMSVEPPRFDEQLVLTPWPGHVYWELITVTPLGFVGCKTKP